MKLSVKYIRPAFKEGEESETDIETTTNLITYSVSKQYPDGLDGNGPVRRMWGRIQRKMDEALENKVNELNLEQGEVDMLTKALSETKFPIGWAKLVSQLEDALYAKGEGDAV